MSVEIMSGAKPSAQQRSATGQEKEPRPKPTVQQQQQQPFIEEAARFEAVSQQCQTNGL